MDELLAASAAFWLMWVGVFWLASAVYAAEAAGSKRRSGFAWFWGGLLFGPLALLALAAAAPGGIACGRCFERIHRKAQTCPHCGVALEVP